ncbi:hypothetical protein RRF57_002508 [Xylaria bambusicola]|uniref:Uncharacterized protein n=1 Tax=Xylaria bambusicola TaxID=326684 RepID=A0AAN7UER0_9PEZI
MPCNGCDVLPPPLAFRMALTGSDGTLGSHNKNLCASCNNQSESKGGKKSPSSKSSGKRSTKHKWVSWELQLNGELVMRT